MTIPFKHLAELLAHLEGNDELKRKIIELAERLKAAKKQKS